MAETSILLSEIETKLRQLIEAKRKLEEANRQLESENKMLLEESATLRSANLELQDKINKSTIVNALGNNEEEIKEGRKLIKELVKEIDTCVSILNTKE